MADEVDRLVELVDGLEGYDLQGFTHEYDKQDGHSATLRVGVED